MTGTKTWRGLSCGFWNTWALNTQLNGLHFTGTIETLPGSYPAFYQNVYEAIRLGKELQVKPEEAALGIRLIELAQQSNAEKRTVLVG